MFFDLIDAALVNSHIVYAKLGNDISLLIFKVVLAKFLIGRYSNRKRFFATSRIQAQKSKNPHPRVPGQMNEIPLLQERRLRSLHFCVLSDMWPVLCFAKKRKHHM